MAEQNTSVIGLIFSSTANVIAVIVTIGTLGFFLPGCIATLRNHKDWLAIWLINFFLGLSVIGWVVALVWSVKSFK